MSQESRVLTAEDLKRIEAITKKWAENKRLELAQNISNSGLVRSGELMRSLRSGIRMQYGETTTIYFKYKWYGLFHDKGANNVGRGQITLPAKHWMARYIYGNQLEDLLTSLSEFYEELAINSIKIDDVKA